MSRSRFSEQELWLEGERFVKYRGTARVRLDVLDFQWNEPRELSRKNVERLKDIFQEETRTYGNIRRLDPRNHIPAVVEQSDLDDAILASEVSAERLLSNPNSDPPMLKFAAAYRLTCLHGRHRIQAAREILPPTDAWWTVDLYLADINPELRTTLVEEYSNEEKPSDGEIYRKIRQYEREGNVCFKKRWKAFLSNHGRRGLRQLNHHGDGEFVAAFDKLLDIRGLWDGMRISTLHKMLDLGCDEEALHYLEHIRKTFYKIFDRILREDKNALQRVDQATVKAFECRAPQHSKRDARVLQGQILSGQICSLFSQQEREAIWSGLLSINYLIPSLFTFFEDLKYLRACADCLKRLVNVSRKDTVRTALNRKFPYVEEAVDQYVVEVAESTFVNRSGRAVDRFDLGYRHLWLFAMRDYREMPPDTKKKSKNLLAKAGVQRADEEVLSRGANLAHRVGFVSDEIDALRQRSDDEIALRALLKARKPNRYQYDQTVLEANVAQIVRLFATASPLPSEYSKPALVCDNPDAARKRCGFPNKDAQQHDSEYLFISHLHHESEEQGEEITSFFVRRSVYLAFFGKSPDLDMDNGPELFPSPPRGPQRTGATVSQESEIDEFEQSRRQRLEREELDRAEAERRERQGHERREQERREHERREQERWEQERREQERREQERWEQERREQERREQERLEREILEQEKRDEERLEQEKRDEERLEQERVELRRVEATLEREDLQERLAEALQARENLEREKQRQQELEKPEQERQEEERRRQQIREQGRREQEKRVNDSERARKHHTEIDIESVLADASGNQKGSSAQTAGPSSGTAGDSRTIVNDQAGGRQERQETLEQERLEQERLEQERLEQERLEQERLTRLEQEKRDQERLERGRLQERFAQNLQQHEKLEQEKQERKRRRAERRGAERQRQETRDQRRWEQEKTSESEGSPEPAESHRNTPAENTRPRRRQDPTPLAQTPDSVWITFKVLDRGAWRTSHSLHVYSSDPSEVERIAVKYMRKREQIRVYDTDLNILTPQMCFQAAMANGSNMLLLIPERDINIDEELEASVSQLLTESGSQVDDGIE